jgi:hypothetical protein
MFIAPAALFEFKLQTSEMYVAPLELRKSIRPLRTINIALLTELKSCDR